jgi:hypothetical protein
MGGFFSSRRALSCQGVLAVTEVTMRGKDIEAPVRGEGLAAVSYQGLGWLPPPV